MFISLTSASTGQGQLLGSKVVGGGELSRMILRSYLQFDHMSFQKSCDQISNLMIIESYDLTKNCKKKINIFLFISLSFMQIFVNKNEIVAKKKFFC